MARQWEAVGGSKFQALVRPIDLLWGQTGQFDPNGPKWLKSRFLLQCNVEQMIYHVLEKLVLLPAGPQI